MSPKQIKVVDKTKLKIVWQDDSEIAIGLQYLRDECPCAECKGETILLKTIRPPKLNVLVPGMYEIKNIEVVGGYAIQISWGDGHDTGIYSWDYLQMLALDEGTDNKHDYKPLTNDDN